ncbi:glutamate--cysteine ligase [Pseudactinotalea sp. HY158]|uniref:glutamate--cysteine ligase n=1 Tax=Pseudactinotalea sp. HY158 TaxID=2654547 RepID=UPI00129C6C2D|nr:glutamate--cysteine ligase [Pseudactinotalea sp. HY158]QGH70376.1 glutamate--cysteine ligase [Pseudactinotalea sp. HY158]
MAIPFAPSDRSTLGVEWELALVDVDSGDLRQVAQTILDAVSPDGSQHPTIRQELMVNTVEVVSRVCRSTGEAMADLQASIRQVEELGAPLRVELMCAGTHPFAHWGSQKVTNKSRYATLIDRTQFWGRQMLIYGVHVHVGIESREKVFPILGALLTYYPHLLALSASSPYWDGRDTGYASNRALLFQQLPTAGLPYTEVDSWEKFERYVGDMLHTGVIEEVDEVRWDIRPSPTFGTIELRIFDGITNAGELAAVVALTHCLVEWLSRRLDAGEELPRISSWFLAENKWRAARYGLEAIIILDEDGNEELVTDAVRRLVEQLAPVAEDLGCADELAGVLEILDGGASYQRQRAVAAAHGGALDAVVAHAVAEFRAGRALPVR